MGFRRNSIGDGQRFSRTNGGLILLPTVFASLLAAKRYWRLQGWSTETLTADTIDLSEIKLFEGFSVQITGSTASSNFAFSSAGITGLTDGTINSGSRAYYPGFNAARSTLYIQFDLGSAKSVSGIQLYPLYHATRFPASFELWSSDTAGSGYSLAIGLNTGAITDLGGDLFRSNEIACGTPDLPNLATVATPGTKGAWRERVYEYVAANPDIGSSAGWKRLTLT